MSEDDVSDARTVADYQFGPSAGDALFPREEDLEVITTSSGRISQIRAAAGRLVTLGMDGRFTLGIEGGRRLHATLDHPRYRVVVGEESAPFVRDGKNAFAKFVASVDPAIRPSDEVLVVDGDDDHALLGVGRAELSADAMLDFDAGMAVQIREGAPE